MRNLPQQLILGLGLLFLAVSCGDDTADPIELAEPIARAYEAGDTAELARLAPDGATRTELIWQAGFEAELGLEVDETTCDEVDDGEVVCELRGTTELGRLAAPDSSDTRIVAVTVRDGEIAIAAYRGGEPWSGFPAFAQWVFANRAELFEPDGACADIGGPSDPTPCAIANREAMDDYLPELG